MTFINLTEEQRAWVDALRSGNYEQGQDYLAQSNRFCCLGVACDMFKERLQLHTKLLNGDLMSYDDEDTGLPYSVQQLLKTSISGDITPWLRPKELRDCLVTSTDKEIAPMEESNRHYMSLVDLNDEGFSFQCIANVIEKYPERIFKNEETDSHK